MVAERRIWRSTGRDRRLIRRRAAGQPRHGSIVGAAIACLLLGAFVGVVGWKLAESATRPDQIEPFDRPSIPAVPPPGPFQDLALAELLRQHEPAVGTLGIYVKSLTTGAEADINGDRPFAAASLYKLPILAEVIRQERLGQIDPNRRLVIGREHWVPGSGVLQARIGESIPVQELLRLLIVESDNIAAMRLLDLAGRENVNQTMRNMGLRSTVLLDWRAPGANNGLGPYTTTPRDVGLLLEIFASGGLVDSEGSEEALGLLERPQAKTWLADGLPRWAKVAHKWGEVPGARHDAGLVYTSRQAYIVVVMTEDVDANRSDDLIRDVSRTVFSYLEGNG